MRAFLTAILLILGLAFARGARAQTTDVCVDLYRHAISAEYSLKYSVVTTDELEELFCHASKASARRKIDASVTAMIPGLNIPATAGTTVSSLSELAREHCSTKFTKLTDHQALELLKSASPSWVGPAVTECLIATGGGLYATLGPNAAAPIKVGDEFSVSLFWRKPAPGTPDPVVTNDIVADLKPNAKCTGALANGTKLQEARRYEMKCKRLNASQFLVLIKTTQKDKTIEILPAPTSTSSTSSPCVAGALCVQGVVARLHREFTLTGQMWKSAANILQVPTFQKNALTTLRVKFDATTLDPGIWVAFEVSSNGKSQSQEKSLNTPGCTLQRCPMDITVTPTTDATGMLAATLHTNRCTANPGIVSCDLKGTISVCDPNLATCPP